MAQYKVKYQYSGERGKTQKMTLRATSYQDARVKVSDRVGGFPTIMEMSRIKPKTYQCKRCYKPKVGCSCPKYGRKIQTERKTKGGNQMAKKKAGRRGMTKRQKVVKYHKQGLTTTQIARKANTTLNSARWYLSKEHLKAHRGVRKKGTRRTCTPKRTAKPKSFWKIGW